VVLVIGTYLLLLAFRGSFHPEVAVLAAGSALALAAVDVVYVSRGVIAKIYLADAAVEVALALPWLTALLPRGN
jgi:hypothetical protein